MNTHDHLRSPGRMTRLPASLGILWLLCTVSPVAAAHEVAAVPAGDFLSSIGVCTHIGQGIDRASPSAAALAYAGVRSIRDHGNPRHVQDWIAVHQKAGIKVVLTWSGPDDDAIPTLIRSSRQLAAAGALLAMEGPNEPNNWAVTYQGQRSESRSTFMPVASWQRAFYARVKSDPLLKQYPVFHSSEAGGSEPDNVGLQFLTIPAGAGTRMPDGTQYADYANIHNYIYTFVYMLRDAGGSDAGWGIFDAGYHPKRAATYLHNLTTILADNGIAKPGKLDYTIPNQPATVHDLLLRKSTGAFDLVIWSEKASGTNRVTVDLGGTRASVKLYDPTAATSPVRALTHVRSIPLVLSDHPMVIEISPQHGRFG